MQQSNERAGARRRIGFVDDQELDKLLAIAGAAGAGRALQPAIPSRTSAPTPTAAETLPEPELPAERNTLFSVYRKLQHDLVTLYNEARRVERHLFGNHWESVIKTPETKEPHDIAYLAMEQLFVQAEARYAPVGGTLKIDRTEVWRALGMEERNHWRNVDRDAEIPHDLDKLYAHLEATYGGEAGETAAYKQHAAELISFFDFEKADKMVVTPKYVESTVRVYSNHKDYAPKGTLEVGYHSQDHIRKPFKALACAMAWAEEFGLQSALRHSPVTGYGFTFTSRHCESYPGLDIVMYKEKWVFRFSHTTAEKLRLFLGQYGA